MKHRKVAVAKNRVNTAQKSVIIARRLRIICQKTLPLYLRIANDQLYAQRVVNAVRTINFDRLTRLIQQEVPGALIGLGSGFSAGLTFGNNTPEFEVGIFRPGRRIQTAEIRRVSQIMLPLLRKFATDRVFTAQFTLEQTRGRPAALRRLARTVVNPQRVISAIIDDFGFIFVVRLINGARYNFVFTTLV